MTARPPARVTRAATTLGATLGVAALALAPGAAQAHSRVLGTDPKDGATLTKAPTRLVVHFNETPRNDFAYAQVKAANGTITHLTTAVEGSDLVATAAAPLADGTYTFAYRVASADTHPVSGSVHFTVATGTASASPTAVPSSATGTTPATTSAASTSSVAAVSPTSSATSSAATSDSSDGLGTSWIIVTALGIVAAIAGWMLGGVVRRRRR